MNLILELQNHLKPKIEKLSKIIAKSISNNSTVFWCGNSRSAADSTHLSAELVGRFEQERVGLSSIALTADTSAFTSIILRVRVSHLGGTQSVQQLFDNDGPAQAFDADD